MDLMLAGVIVVVTLIVVFGVGWITKSNKSKPVSKE